MNPLCLTWAQNIFTRAGWNNFNNLTKVGELIVYYIHLMVRFIVI